MEKKEFIDEFVDRIYLIGSKENGKYILTLSQAEEAASELYDVCFETLYNPDTKEVDRKICPSCKDEVSKIQYMCKCGYHFMPE